MDKNKLHQKFTKVLYTLLFLMLILILISSKGNAISGIINVTQDTYVKVSSPTSNYGNITYLTTELDEDFIYLEFPISQIPQTNGTHTVEINEGLVCLWLYYVSTVAGDYTTINYLNNTFDEMSLTYNDNYEQYWATCFTETLLLTRAINQLSWVCFNMTDALQYAHFENLDYIDFVLKSDADDANYFEYDSKENTPYLQVPYFSYNYIITEDGTEPEEPEEPEPKLFTPIDLSQTSNVIFLFILVFFYLGVMALGFIFKNGGFVSFGFFIGIVLGFMLSVFHIFLTLLFFLMNVIIFISFVRKGK